MTHLNQPPLEDVLDIMLVTYGEPTPQAIADFAQRYPAYRSELYDFAVDWAEEECLPKPEELTENQKALVTARAQSLFHNIAYEQQGEAGAAQVSASVSLAQLAKRAGKTLDDVRKAIGFDHGLIAKLNNRRIRPDSIPARIARAIAAVVGAPEAQVHASWTGPPRALAMSFHSQKAPVIPHKEDFAIAVAQSTLSPEEKAALLADN